MNKQLNQFEHFFMTEMYVPVKLLLFLYFPMRVNGITFYFGLLVRKKKKRHWFWKFETFVFGKVLHINPYSYL